MMTQIDTVIHKSNMSVLRMAVLSSVVATSLLAGGAVASESEQAHAGHGSNVPAKLVQVVRDATRPYIDVNAAVGYEPAFGCVSGPDHGAMGIHYINSDLVGDGEVDATRPEALIYEPSRAGLRLVGVEYIVDSAAWTKNHTSPPMLEGQAFQFVNSPNRYGIPAFFELHVWAWRENPNGAFVDWNNRVSCEGQ